MVKQIVLAGNLREILQWCVANNWSRHDVIAVTPATGSAPLRGYSTNLEPVTLPSWNPNDELRAEVERLVWLARLAYSR